MDEIAFANYSAITLPERCSREGISDLHRLLSDRLPRLLSGEPALERVELDFSGVREIDACGGQLLALFAGHLARRDIPTVSRNLAGGTADTLALLGFAAALAHPAAATEQTTGSSL